MKAMTLGKAVQIKQEIAEARKKWGRQASVNYTVDDIIEAIATLHEAETVFGSASVGEQITKLKRQLAACQNREKARIAKKRSRTQTDLDDHVGDDEEVT